MANRTDPWQDKEIRGKRTTTIAIQDTVTVFIGSYVALNPVSGRVDRNSDTATYVNYGIVVEFDSPLQDDGSATGDVAGTVKAIVDLEGGIVRQVAVAGAAAETDVGDQVSLATDNVETDLKTAANVNTVRVGEIVRFHTSSSFDVLLYTQETMRGF